MWRDDTERPGHVMQIIGQIACVQREDIANEKSGPNQIWLDAAVWSVLFIYVPGASCQTQKVLVQTKNFLVEIKN